jgi:hypothetical protein
MGKGDDNMSFAEVLDRASQIPDDTGKGATFDLPQLFSPPIPENELIVDDEPAPDPQRIGAVPKYKMRAHFQRFVMGPIVNMEGGEVHVEEHDDTASYEEVQNLCLEGKAILCWEKTNFLKDGGVVIAMKWMTKHDPEEYDRLYARSDDTTEN